MEKDISQTLKQIADCINIISPIPPIKAEGIFSKLQTIQADKTKETDVLDSFQVLSNVTKDFDITCDAFNFLFKRPNQSFLHYLVTLIVKTNKKISSEWLCNFIKNFPLSKEDFQNCFKVISQYLNNSNLNIITLQNIISVIKAFYQINQQPNQHYFSFFPGYNIILESKQKDSKKPHIGFFTCISLDLTYFAKYKNNCNIIEAGNFKLQLTSDLRILYDKNSMGPFKTNEIINIYIDYQYSNKKISVYVFNKSEMKQSQFSTPKQNNPTQLKILNGFVGKVYSICGAFVSSPINENKIEIIKKKINYNFDILNEVKNVLDKVSGAESNINQAFFFSFNAYNYYQNESNIFDDATRNYGIVIGKGIFVHQNKNYTSNINLIGGINEILPVLKILNNNNEELKKCNDDLIKNIISIICPLYKINELDNKDFIKVLSYFFEQFPENIFIDIKSLLDLMSIEKNSDVIQKDIIFNHKIVVKYFFDKDKNNNLKTYIEFLKNKKNIVPQKLIVDLFYLLNNEMKGNNEICCDLHGKNEASQISNEYLQKLKDLLKLIDLSKEDGRDEVIKGLFSNLVNGVSPCLKLEIYNILKKQPKCLIELNSKSLDAIFKPEDKNFDDFKFLLLLYNVFTDEYKEEKESNYCIEMKFLEEVDNKIKSEYLNLSEKKDNNETKFDSNEFLLKAAKYLLSSENDKYFETTLNFYFYLCTRTKKGLMSESFNKALEELNNKDFDKNWKNKVNEIISNINDIFNDNIDSNVDDIKTDSFKTILNDFNGDKVNFILLVYYITMTKENDTYNNIFIEIIKTLSKNEGNKINKDNIHLFFNDKYLYSKISNFLRKKIMESHVETIDKYIETYNEFVDTFLNFSKDFKYIADFIYYEIALSLKQIKSLIDEKDIKEKQQEKVEKIKKSLFDKIIIKLDPNYSTDDQIEQRRIAKIKKEGFREDKFGEDDDKEEIVYIPFKNNGNYDFFIEEIRCNFDSIPLKKVDFIEEYQKIIEVDNKFNDIKRLTLYNRLVKRFFENNNFWQLKTDNELPIKIKNYYTNDFKRPIITYKNDFSDYKKKFGNEINTNIFNYLISSKDVAFSCLCEKVNRSIFGVIIINNNDFYFQGFEKNNEYKEINFKLDEIDFFMTCVHFDLKNSHMDINDNVIFDKTKKTQLLNVDLSRKIALYLNNKKQYLFTFIDMKMKNCFIELLRSRIKDLIEITFSKNSENIGYSKREYLKKLFNTEINDPFDFCANIDNLIKFPISKISMYEISNFRNPLNIQNYPKWIESNKKYKIKLIHPYDNNDFNLNGSPEIYYLPEIYQDNYLNNIISANSEIIKEGKQINYKDGTGSQTDKGIKLPAGSIIYSAESLDDTKIVIVSDCAINIKTFFSAWFGNDNSIYNYYYAHFSQKYYTTHGKDGKDPPNYLSNHIAFSKNKMFCFMGGLQDGNLIYFNLNSYGVPYIIETEYINKEKNVISALVIVEKFMGQYYLVCGDTCGNIILFLINENYAIDKIHYPNFQQKIQVTKQHIDTNSIINGLKKVSIHYKEITSMAINSTKDILVTSSEDYCINLISFPDFRIIKSIKNNYITNYVYIFNYPFPCLLTFSNNQNSYHEGIIRLLTLNGKELQSENLKKFNHPRCIELYGNENTNMSTVFFQSDHQNISIWNINTFKGKLKNFNGTNMMNYGICFDLTNQNANNLVINGYLGVRITSNFTFQLEKLSIQ